VPSEWPLDFIPPLTFIAMLTPTLKDRPAIAAALCAGVVALLAYSLPYRLGIILAALVGIFAGVFLERQR
jgi:predicted branched-subunit amino acid permease